MRAFVFFAKCFLCFSFFFSAKTGTAQSAEKSNESFYRFTVGLGYGKSNPIVAGGGISGTAEFAYQRKNQLFALGTTGVSELNIVGENVHDAVSSINVTYGRAIMRHGLFASVNGGVGIVTLTEHGALISSEGWFGYNTYEIRQSHTIGLSVSAKLFAVTRFLGAGVELFGNVNGKSSFGGISFCLQAGKLQNKRNHKN